MEHMIAFIIATLKKHDSAIWVENDRLKVTARNELNVNNFKSLLKKNKQELIEFLKLNGVFSKNQFARKCILKYPQEGAIPLSFSQEGLWFIDQYQNGSNAYHIPYLLELDHSVDLYLLQKSINCIADRHKVLRTVIELDEENTARQKITGHEIVINHIITSKKYLKIHLKKDIYKYFNLQFNIPIRVTCYNIIPKLKNKQARYLLINFHHIAFDLWSANIFFNELHKIYQSLTDKCIPQLDNIDIQYYNYAIWQRNYSSLESQLEFWKEKLITKKTVNFPTDFQRPNHINYSGLTHKLKLSSETTMSLYQLAKSTNCTLHTVLLTGLFILIYKYTNQNDITIGEPIANRFSSELDGLIGYFVNMIVVYQYVSGNQNSKELIKNIHQYYLESLPYQSMPFEGIVDELQYSRESNIHPVFQISFSYHEHNPIKTPFYKLISSETPYNVSKFDLSFILEKNDNELFININYATSLFKNNSICRLAKIYALILGQMVSDPNKLIQDYETLTRKEYQNIIFDWNNTNKNYPTDKLIHQLFEKQAITTPNNTAIISENEKMSYAVLNDKANQLAHYLVKSQQDHTRLPSDTLIIIYLNRSIDMIIAILAVLKAGAAFVPISTSFPKERIKYILDDTNYITIITESQLHKELIDFIDINDYYIINVDVKPYINEEITNLKYCANPTDLAYVIYTSGTTGRPKGVMIEHKSLVNMVLNISELLKIDSSTIATQYANLVFDASIYEIFPNISSGAQLVIVNEEQQNNLELFLELVKDHQVTLSFIPTAVLKQILLYYPTKLTQKIIYTGGSNLSGIKYCHQEINLYNQYGLTEATVCSTSTQILNSETITIGKPLDNTKAYVLDNNLHPVPIGVIGELYLGGAGLARGYLNKPELNAEKFIENKFATEEDIDKVYTKLFKTGDLVKWTEDGNLCYVCRNDSQIKIRGYRIELQEIEAVLEEHSLIQQALVIAHEKKSENIDSLYIIAYYISDKIINDNEISFFLKQKLPDYMIPEVYIKINEIPLTTSGKVDNTKLSNLLFFKNNKKEKNLVKSIPTTTQEHLICKAFTQILDRECINIDGDFFDLGGNSLKVIKLVALLKDNFDIQIATVFKFRTPRMIAKSAKHGHNMIIEKLRKVKSFYANQTIKEINQTKSSNHIKAKYSNSFRNIDIDPNNKKQISHVMITGATGFLGCNILHQLLKTTDYSIILPIRDSSVEHATNRLKTIFHFYFGICINKQFKLRIKIILADLAEDNLGLTCDNYNMLIKNVDSIIHSAALTKHYASSYDFYISNVTSTINLLKLCFLTKLKDFNYISTYSTLYYDNENSRTNTIYTENNIHKVKDHEQCDYIKSKLLGEWEVINSYLNGVNYNIYRVGNLAFINHSGMVQKNINENSFGNWIKALQILKCIPNESNLVEISPVDLTAEAICLLFDKKDLSNQIYHVYNPSLFNLANSFANTQTASVELVSMESFINRIINELSNPEHEELIIQLLERQSLLNTGKKGKNSIEILQNRTDYMLNKLGFTWKMISNKNFSNYLSNLNKSWTIERRNNENKSQRF